MTKPPRKRAGHPTGRRRLDGELLDVAAVAELLGTSEKCVRARVARHCIPFRKFGARITFRRSELLDFLDRLQGVDVGEALANATRERP